MIADRSAARPPRILRPTLPPAVLGAIVLIAGVALLDSDWFSLIRYAVSILALVAAVIAVQHRKWWWALPLLPLAVVWNPVWPLEFPGGVWTAAHYVGGLVFLLVGALARVPDEA